MKDIRQTPKEFFKQKLAIISTKPSILDIGGGECFQKGLKDVCGQFKNTKYRSLDIPGIGSDIIGDIDNIPLQSDGEHAVICNAVLEHVEDPVRTVKEIHRILVKGEAALAQVPSIYLYHGNKGYDGKPGCGDYWRFFDDSMMSMFKDFSSIEIRKQGGYFSAMSSFSPFISSTSTA